MKTIAHAFVALLALLITFHSARATTITYTIKANIDTTDLLLIQGATLQWQHTGTGAVVGRHGKTPLPTTINSALDGVSKATNLEWLPDWPTPLPKNPLSSTFATLDPPMPASPDCTITVSKASGRGEVSVQTPPSAANNYTLIITFADHGNSSSDLAAKITLTLPDPPANPIASTPAAAPAAPAGPAPPIASPPGTFSNPLTIALALAVVIALAVIALLVLRKAKKAPPA